MSFSIRLNKAKAKAGLTIGEIAAWFGDVSAQAVWLWSAGKTSPQKYRREQVERALGYLEKELQRKAPRLPLPLSVRLGDRLKYVRNIRASYR